MIDAHRTGAAISRLRRARDWTQVELAERLHVTHQAVSRWETGDSFPDVGSLHSLSQLLEVSVDELLSGTPRRVEEPAGAAGQSGGAGSSGGSGEAQSRPSAAAAVVEELAQGNTRRVSEMVQDGRADLESVAEVGPLVRPSQMEEVVRGVTEQTNTAINIEQMVALAPFVSGELLQELVDRLVADPVEADKVVALAPFLPASAIDDLFGRIADGTLDLDHLSGLAPFAGKATLDKLVAQVIENGGAVPIERVVAIAPFLSRDSLGRLVEHLREDPANADHLTGLAPFLDQETLKGLLERLPTGGASARTLAALAPFLDQETLEALIRRQFPTPSVSNV